MFAFIAKLLGPALVSWLAQWFGQRQRDRLLVEAESAKRAGEALEAAKEANKREAEIRTLPDDALNERLSKFTRRKP